jgi:hypothetical protein
LFEDGLANAPGVFPLVSIAIGTLPGRVRIRRVRVFKHRDGATFEDGANRQWRKTMKPMRLRTVAIAASTFAGAALLSFGWAEQGGVSLSVESAQARVGRPLTPVSAAGVARRQNRRAAYGYGAGAVGAGVAGAAALGTAAAVAATSPNWGWGTNPYYGGRPYYGGAFAGTVDARASYGGPAYYGGPASTATTSSAPWTLTGAYYSGGPWYGYNGWDDYAARNGISCRPGTMVKGDNGLMYPCQ